MHSWRRRRSMASFPTRFLRHDQSADVCSVRRQGNRSSARHDGQRDRGRPPKVSRARSKIFRRKERRRDCHWPSRHPGRAGPAGNVSHRHLPVYQHERGSGRAEIGGHPRDWPRNCDAARSAKGKIAVVAGKALVLTGAGEQLQRLIELGYVDRLFAGNAFAVYDVERSPIRDVAWRKPDSTSPWRRTREPFVGH